MEDMLVLFLFAAIGTRRVRHWMAKKQSNFSAAFPLDRGIGLKAGGMRNKD